jgi:ribosomal protein S18 acetylase RimI-like enzyme
MPSIEPITPHNVQAFKSVRLQALQDSPGAFGSTYARESAFSEDEWLSRAVNMNGEKRIGYLAMDNELPCGIIGSFLDEQNTTQAQVIAMWVAPAYRRTGLGSALIAAIQGWARSKGISTLLLMVTSNNHAAIAFYQRLGFTLTGRTEPYPNDPLQIEYEMSQPVPPESPTPGPA